MKIKCIKNSLESQEQDRYGDRFYPQDFHVTPGKEYTVLGITFVRDKKVWGTGVYYELDFERRRIIRVPIDCFEVIDHRISLYWVAKEIEDGFFAIWPDLFFKEFFHDDLYESVETAVGEFEQIVNLMVNEHELL